METCGTRWSAEWVETRTAVDAVLGYIEGGVELAMGEQGRVAITQHGDHGRHARNLSALLVMPPQ